MAALNFPINPSINDVYTFGLRSWQWTGTTWRAQGVIGYTGSQGPAGGYTGSASTVAGYTGSQGPAGGYTGSIGDKGFTGSQGDKGYNGSRGDTGYTGSASTVIGYTGSIGYAGSQGNKGGIRYNFNASTSVGTSTNGEIRYDNTPPSSVANIYININDINGVNFSSLIALWSSSNSTVKGQLIITDNLNTVAFTNVFNITGNVVNNTTYYTIPVTFVSGTAVPANNQTLSIQFTRFGDTVIGYTGSQGPPVGYTGSQGVGYTGSQGIAGNAATIAVGSVVVGAGGSTPVVSNAGTSSAATFNFTIPAGYSGSKGDVGYTGSQGIAGNAATIAVGTSTIGAGGSNPIITNVGTSSAATLNFVIPAGYTGSQSTIIGYTGSQGVVGYTGSQSTVVGYTGSKGDPVGYTGSASTVQGPTGYTGSAATTIPINSQSTAYTLQVTDNGYMISITTGGVTVPNGIFSPGHNINIFNNSVNDQTITQGAGVTMYLVGTNVTGNRTLSQYGFATVICITSNTFIITGGGLS